MSDLFTNEAAADMQSLYRLRHVTTSMAPTHAECRLAALRPNISINAPEVEPISRFSLFSHGRSTSCRRDRAVASCETSP